MYRQPSLPTGVMTPSFLRAVVGGAEAVAGLSLAPDIPVKKLQGAMTFANVGADEQPLALVDTSILQSGKTGMLLTNRALYLDAPRVRVPVEAITQHPVPKSGNTFAHVVTAAGTVTLPGNAPDDAVTAMLNVLRAVAMANRGATRFALSHAPVHGPVGELAAMTLRPPELGAAPAVIPSRVHVASNLAPGWLDHDSGEELLCLVDETVSHDGTRGIALTDRRLLAYGDRPVEIPYPSLTSFTFRKSMLSSTMVLGTPQGYTSLETIAPEPVALALAEFLNRLGAIPTNLRHAAWSPARTADDPSGAAAAMRAIAQPDVRAATLLELIHAAVAQGAVTPDVGFDLTQRAVRVHLSLRGGHGRTGVMQRSPLSAADLCTILIQLLGAPAWQGYEANGQVMDFEIGRAGSMAGTVASNVVGIALLAVVGVGWVTTGGGGGVQRVRARVWEVPGGAGFTLTEVSGAPLAKGSAKLAAALLTSLAELSATVLLRRVVNGWSAPLEQLLREPLSALDGRIRAVSPQADLAVFLRG